MPILGILSSGGKKPIVTGGTVTYDGAYTIRTFTSSDTLTVTNGPLIADALIVGGGASGCGNIYAVATPGGNGGEVVASSSLSMNGSYAVTVGLGGSGTSANSYTQNAGGTTSIGALVTALGGQSQPSTGAGAAARPGGGRGAYGSSYSANSTSATSGTTSSISGTSYAYSGGGGCSGSNQTNISGTSCPTTSGGSAATGAGAGGAGSCTGAGGNGSAATNYGAGGGAGGCCLTTGGAGGAGGNGIVILKYLTQ